MASSVTINNGVNSATISGNKIAFKGITVTNEKVWTSDTGRSTTGLMMGKIVAIKHTFSIKLVGLSVSDYNTIEAVITNKTFPFFYATVNDGVKTYSSVEVYAASTSVTVYNDKVAKYFDYTMELVER